MLAIY